MVDDDDDSVYDKSSTYTRTYIKWQLFYFAFNAKKKLNRKTFHASQQNFDHIINKNR